MAVERLLAFTDEHHSNSEETCERARNQGLWIREAAVWALGITLSEKLRKKARNGALGLERPAENSFDRNFSTASWL